jgi:hypothetical protein
LAGTLEAMAARIRIAVNDMGFLLDVRFDKWTVGLISEVSAVVKISFDNILGFLIIKRPVLIIYQLKYPHPWSKSRTAAQKTGTNNKSSPTPLQ